MSVPNVSQEGRNFAGFFLIQRLLLHKDILHGERSVEGDFEICCGMFLAGK